MRVVLRVGAHNAHDSKAAVAEALGLVDLYLGNEAVPVDVPGWGHRTGGKGVVTAWDTSKLTHVRSRWHKAHGRMARGVPTPERGSLVSEFAEMIATVNGHRQNGHGWEGNKKRFLWRMRRRNWNDHDEMDHEICADLHDAGYTILFGTDLNRINETKPHPDAVPLRNGGITQLWLIPARAEVEVGKGGSVAGLARGSGHRLQWRDVTVWP